MPVRVTKTFKDRRTGRWLKGKAGTGRRPRQTKLAKSGQVVPTDLVLHTRAGYEKRTAIYKKFNWTVHLRDFSVGVTMKYLRDHAIGK